MQYKHPTLHLLLHIFTAAPGLPLVLAGPPTPPMLPPRLTARPPDAAPSLLTAPVPGAAPHRGLPLSLSLSLPARPHRPEPMMLLPRQRPASGSDFKMAAEPSLSRMRATRSACRDV